MCTECDQLFKKGARVRGIVNCVSKKTTFELQIITDLRGFYTQLNRNDLERYIIGEWVV